MIIAVLGCSGSGKTVLTNIFVHHLGCQCPVHVTTRLPRNDDNGFYQYVTKEKFLEMQKNNLFFCSSGDGIRYYGVEKKEIERLLREDTNIIINISLKDLEEISRYSNVLVIMARYKHLVTGFFNSNVVRKVGIREAVKRFFIYIHDRIRYQKYVKRVTHYFVEINTIPRLLIEERE